MTKNRKTYLDVLRIIAIFLVLFTHTYERGSKIYTLTDDSVKQLFYCLLDSFRTVNNPLLFMISGVLLLGKQESIKTIWQKRIFRFAIVLVLFSFIQYAFSTWQSGLSLVTEFNLINFLTNTVSKPIVYSYWYLYSYIAFLIMLPFVRKLAEMPDDLMVYLIIILAITEDVFPWIVSIFGLSRINLDIGTWTFVPFYPLLGYFLENNWDKLKHKKIYLAILGVLSLFALFANAYCTINNHTSTGVWDETYIFNFNIVRSIFVFVLIKELFSSFDKKRATAFLEAVSSTVFGIYLMEDIFESITSSLYDIFSTYMCDILSCLLWLIITMGLGSIVVFLLKKIPLINKLI